MKTIITTVFLSLSIISYSQVKSINISVDGFTCSLCAKGVEGQFKALDFVKDVKTNLSEATFDLKFKSGKQVKIEQIREAVDDGGFTVGSVSLEASGTISVSGNNYVLVTGNTPDLKLENITGDIKDGDKVSVKGEINTKQTVNVKSITKI